MSTNSEHPMRRADRHVNTEKDIERVFKNAGYINVAFQTAGAPYIVPFNFGRDGDIIYLHCAPEGRKLDCMLENQSVGFCLVADAEVFSAEIPCKSKSRYRSVIGTATARIVTDEAGQIEGLNAIMRQYGSPEGPYAKKMLERTLVVALDIVSMTGKQSGF